MAEKTRGAKSVTLGELKAADRAAVNSILEFARKEGGKKALKDLDKMIKDISKDSQ